MPTEDTDLTTAVADALRSGKFEAVHWATFQAVELGAAGDRLLADALRSAKGEEGPARLSRLVGVVRGSWSRLHADERQWFTTHWPQVAPDGPDAAAVAPPDPARQRA